MLAAAPSTESLVVSIICDRSGSFYASLTWSIVLFVVYLPGAHVAAPILAKLEGLPKLELTETRASVELATSKEARKNTVEE